ncbi:MAG: periplasmic heavy metal sensor [Planctomycetota bacterium]
MVKKLSSLILVFSLALNLAFVGVWAYHEFYVEPRMGGRRGRFHRWDRDDHRYGDHDDHDEHDDDDHWRKGPPLKGKLDLTREQWKALRKSRRRLATRMKKRMEEVEERREELFDLLMKDDVKKKTIDEALSELSEARARLTRATVEHMLELKDVLRPEQQRFLLKMIRERTAGHGRALREFVGGRGKGPRPHRGRDGGRRRRRRGAPPHTRDSHGPKEPGRQR